MPGSPATTPQNSGATTPSERFSASDSTAARPTPPAIETLRVAPDDQGNLATRLG